MAPPLSVVMPVFNALPYLDRAVASILAQSFADFEFVILDDSSTDGSRHALRGWAMRDRRIRLVESEQRLGPVGSSARAVAEARAPVVARMDADDESHPHRLRRQLSLLCSHPGTGLVASLHETIDPRDRIVRGADKARLLRPSHFAPFVHGSIMVRRAALEAAGGYRSGCDYWEDIDLFLRMAREAPALVLVDPLYRHRLARTSTRRTGGQREIAHAYRRLFESLGPAAPAGGRRAIPPQAFPLLGSPLVWSGERPGLLGLLLREAALGADAASASALAWTAWAELSPRSLRAALRVALAWRNRSAAAALAGREWVEWAPPRSAASPA